VKSILLKVAAFGRRMKARARRMRAWVGRVRLELAEAAFILVFLAGVAMVYVPAALMIGGALGVLVVERASVRGGVRQKTDQAGSQAGLRSVA
jgi:hypothetical protein